MMYKTAAFYNIGPVLRLLCCFTLFKVKAHDNIGSQILSMPKNKLKGDVEKVKTKRLSSGLS